MHQKKIVIGVLLFFIAYAGAGFLLLNLSGNFFNRIIVWNLLLATVPLVLVMGYLRVKRAKLGLGIKRLIGVLCGVGWLLVFPNAPYMITDFIHVGVLNLFDFSPQGVYYARNLIDWAELLHISLGVLAGLSVGYYSLYLLQMLVTERFGAAKSWMFVCGITLISSYGVFIGRFVRLNSWDVLSPSVVIRGLAENADHFTLWFTLLFSLFMFLSYSLFYLLVHRSDREKSFQRPIAEK